MAIFLKKNSLFYRLQCQLAHHRPRCLVSLPGRYSTATRPLLGGIMEVAPAALSSQARAMEVWRNRKLVVVFFSPLDSPATDFESFHIEFTAHVIVAILIAVHGREEEGIDREHAMNEHCELRELLM